MQTTHLDKWIEGIGPDHGAVQAAVLTLRSRLEVVQHFLPLAAYEADQEVEYVHELRVWSRRAAAALKLYAEFLPRRRSAWVKKRLKRIRRVASDARDCDVEIERLGRDDPDEARLRIKKLCEERTGAQPPIAAVCAKLEAGDRFRGRVAKLLERVRVRATEEANSHTSRFADWARAGLQPLVERFFEAVPPDDADEKRLHLLRIRGKQLRYAMELLAPAFAREFRERLYPVVEELQDRLGRINDLAVSLVRLDDDPDSRAAAKAGRGDLYRNEQRRLDLVREEFRQWWTPSLRRDLRAGFDAALHAPSGPIGPIGLNGLNGRTPAASPRPPPAETVARAGRRSVDTPSPLPEATPPAANSPAAIPSAATPKPRAASKSRIVGELGALELLLPSLVNEALAANDRAKYLMTLLQTAREQADHPDPAVNDLKQERLAVGVVDGSLDRVVERSRVESTGVYRIPACGAIHEQLVREIRTMISPVLAAPDEGNQPANAYERRLAALRAEAPPSADDLIPGDYVDRLTSARRDRNDSLHLLVMDLHKELNRLQQRIANESIDGACAYGIRESDRPIVAAFMAGVNQTRPLKFDHPGLGTTATRAGEKLVIQNDIGTTDAHVLVVHVEGLQVTLTYTDVHIERLVFFQNLFAGFAVAWDDTRSRRTTGLEEDLYHLCLGTFTARDPTEQEAYLRFLGSRLVFLIDWNRARKRLRKFARRRICLEVLRWAAAENIGHMGFLVLGGDQLLFDALQSAGRPSLPPGGQLADTLGDEKLTEFLKFTLRTASDGLLAGRSEFLIRDQIGTELRRYVATVQQGFLDLAARHSSLIVELATASRDGLEAARRGDRDFLERTAARAKKWEHQADELVKKSREARTRGGTAEKTPELLEQADDAADELEEALFLLTLLPDDREAAAFDGPLDELAELVVQGAEEYLKCVENARGLHRAGPREQVQDFLEAVDRTLTIEHDSDAALRRAQASVPTFAGDCRQLHLFTEIAANLEQAVDSLLHSALTLRDYILGDVLSR